MKYWQGLSLLFSMTVIISCNSENPNHSDPENKVQTVSGQLTAPAYTSAKVWLDMDNDGKHHKDEPSVSVNPETGSYQLHNIPTEVAESTPLAAEIIIKSGQRQTLTAPPQSDEISALSTMTYENPNNYVNGQYQGGTANHFLNCANEDQVDSPTFLHQKQICDQLMQDIMQEYSSQLDTAEFESIPVKTKLAVMADAMSQHQKTLANEMRLRLQPENANVIGYDNLSQKSKQALMLNKNHILTKAKLADAKRKRPMKMRCALPHCYWTASPCLALIMRICCLITRRSALICERLKTKTERMSMQGNEFVLNPLPTNRDYYIIEGEQAQLLTDDYHVDMPENLGSSVNIPLVQTNFPSMKLNLTVKAIDISNDNMQAVLGHQSNLTIGNAPIMSDWVNMLPTDAKFGQMAKTYIFQMKNKNDIFYAEHNPEHCTELDDICNIVPIYKDSAAVATPALSLQGLISESASVAPYDEGNFILIEQVGQKKLMMQLTADGEATFFHEKFVATEAEPNVQGAPEKARTKVGRSKVPITTSRWERIYSPTGGTEIAVKMPYSVKLLKPKVHCLRTYKKVRKKLVSGCKIPKGSVIGDNNMLFNRPAARDVLSLMRVSAISEGTMPMLDTMDEVCRDGDSMFPTQSDTKTFLEYIVASLNCGVNDTSQIMSKLDSTHDLVEYDINGNPIRRISLDGNGQATISTLTPAMQFEEQYIAFLSENGTLSLRPRGSDSASSPLELYMMQFERESISVKRFKQIIETIADRVGGEFNDDDRGVVDTKLMMLEPKPST